MIPYPCRSRFPRAPRTVALLFVLGLSGCGGGDVDPARTFENLPIRVQVLEGREVQLENRRAVLVEENLIIILDPLHLTGTLDSPDRPFTTGLLTISRGDSPIAMELLVAVQEEGEMRYFHSVPFGAPARLEGIRYEGGRIVVNVLNHGPDDPACCPTVPVERSFHLMGTELMEDPRILEAEEVEPEAGPEAGAEEPPA